MVRFKLNKNIYFVMFVNNFFVKKNRFPINHVINMSCLQNWLQNNSDDLQKGYINNYYTMKRWPELNLNDIKGVPVNVTNSSEEDKYYTLDDMKVYANIDNFESNSDLIIHDTSEDSVISIKNHHNNENNSFKENSSVDAYKFCPLFDQKIPNVNNIGTCESLPSKINVSFSLNLIQP